MIESSESKLTLQPLRIHLRLEAPWQQPFFAGSLLRGLFGHSLRRLACMTHQKECKGCPLLNNCPYPQVFEPQAEVFSGQHKQAPVPYVIQPPTPAGPSLRTGDSWVFEQILIGRAQQQLPLILIAWQQAFKRGLGPQRTPVRLEKIDLLNARNEVLDTFIPGDSQVPPSQGFSPLEQPYLAPNQSSLTLNWLSPLRLRRDNRYLKPEQITARDLLMNTIRRVSLLEQLHLKRPPEHNFTTLSQLADSTDLQQELQWVNWRRWSNRQQTKMDLGGVMGTTHLQSENLSKFAPFLNYLPWLNLGKNCSFGLGRCQITPTAKR